MTRAPDRSATRDAPNPVAAHGQGPPTVPDSYSPDAAPQAANRRMSWPSLTNITERCRGAFGGFALAMVLIRQRADSHQESDPTT